MEVAMQPKHLQFGNGFRVLLGDRHSQAVQMTLAPGQAEGGPDNRHRGADQWLYVVSGTGTAVIDGEPMELRAGTLLLI
jgi:mannose-6-phosphate isomerase-like protein (cupin superfamily)